MLKRTFSFEDTIAFGKDILRELDQTGRRNIFLFGGLGAGKTTLVKGIGRELGIEEEIISPTFQLVRNYDNSSGRVLAHIDLYRSSSPEEILGLGWWDYIESPCITAVEWAERAEGILPPDGLFVRMSFKSETERDIEIFSSRDNVFADRNYNR